MELSDVGDKARFTVNDKTYEVFIEESDKKGRKELIHFEEDSEGNINSDKHIIHYNSRSDNKITEDVAEKIVENIQDWAN